MLSSGLLEVTGLQLARSSALTPRQPSAGNRESLFTMGLSVLGVGAGTGSL